MSITVEKLCAQLSLDFIGDGQVSLDSVCGFQSSSQGQLTFLISEKVINSDNYKTSAVLITNHKIAEKVKARAIIFSNHPQLSFAQAVPFVIDVVMPVPGISRKAVLSDGAKIDSTAAIAAGAVIEADVEIGANVSIGANVFIGIGSCIGKGTKIDANVTIYPHTKIGQDCQISSGTVIGAPGFGIIPDADQWQRFPQTGKVIIGDRVDVGSNCCIDRGAIEDTVIGSGVKLDNLIQIAHNVLIGENTVIAACTGIAGSAIIGKNCQIGGRSSIQGHIAISDRVVITAVSFVNKSITKPGVYSSSLSAQENHLWLKNHARLHRLDKITKRINSIDKRLNSLFEKENINGK